MSVSRRQGAKNMKHHVRPGPDGTVYFDAEAVEGADAAAELAVKCQRCTRDLMTIRADVVGIAPHQEEVSDDWFQPVAEFKNLPGIAMPADHQFGALGDVVAFDCRACRRTELQLSWERQRPVLLELWRDATKTRRRLRHTVRI